MIIAPEDASYLIESIKSGRAMLVLGAGASVESKNRDGEQIKLASALAKVITEKAGLQYRDETLPVVLSAVRGSILSDLIIKEILIKEYKETSPSDCLEKLFSYCWKRVYSWNIDDTLENINKRKAQRMHHYHGIDDKSVDFEGHNVTHVIHLHGQITKVSQSFILTETEYLEALNSNKHYWYQRLAQDYLATCPIFIGSKLAEPILFAELERAKREGNLVSGRAYLITPDDLSVVETRSLAAKGIIHIRETLEGFQKWLAKTIPAGWLPADILSHNRHYDSNSLHLVTREELAAAFYLRPIELPALKAEFAAVGPAERNLDGRRFLQGHHPTWRVAASDIPVELDGYEDVFSSLKEAIAQNNKIFIVSGQAGSGKTTALMAACLRHQQEFGTPIYNLDPDVKSVKRAVALIKRIQKTKIILYVGDLFIYGDNFSTDIDSFSGQDIIVVSTVRSGEWNEHLVRHLGDRVRPYQFQRFVKKDFEPLISRLLSFVPSPVFRALEPAERLKKFASSKNQLMIALREATESEQFDRTIIGEFRKLPDEDTRTLFVIVGLATLSRVGISTGAAREAYSGVAKVRPFGRALEALEGIVSETTDGRLLARHDVYVRHVLDKAVSFENLLTCIKAILRTFLKYNIPVIKSVRRLDGILFKFIINHNLLSNQARRHGRLGDGREFYSEFEIDFQLDGHFWLQYGLFLSGIGQLSEAIVMLRRSIDAYPDNPFAVHALADIRLRMAREMIDYNELTRDLIAEAVSSLNQQDAETGIVFDQYPIVTLALGHVGALLKHNEIDEARERASIYFKRIQVVERNTSAVIVVTTRERLFRFLTLGEWESPAVRRNRRRSRGSRNRGVAHRV